MHLTEGQSLEAAQEGDPARELARQLDKVAHLLPSQGPIEVFVHHNTLHMFEELSFNEALRRGYQVFGGEPYLAEREYRQMLKAGRIQINEIETALEKHLGERGAARIGKVTSRFELQLAMLRHPLRSAEASELDWVLAETDALARFQPEIPLRARDAILRDTRDAVMSEIGEDQAGRLQTPQRRSELDRLLADAGGDPSAWTDDEWTAFALRHLWNVCRRGLQGTKLSLDRDGHAYRRPRDLVMSATGVDTDIKVHEVLIRFCASFLDQGYADWTLPERDRGMFAAFVDLYSQPYGPPDRWLRGLREELTRIQCSHTSPEQSIFESLDQLGVAPEDREAFLEQTLLALRGWAGMIWQLETTVDWVERKAPPGSLLEFLAVRLILERYALREVAEAEASSVGSPKQYLEQLQREARFSKAETLGPRTFVMFQVVQMLGCSGVRLESLDANDWQQLADETLSFDSLSRRQLYQQAYETHYRIATLDAVAAHAKAQRQVLTARGGEVAKVNQQADASSRLDRSETNCDLHASRPSFQICCCIDDREESFRRHLEEIAPSCETFGAAGFFAVAMYYQGAADAHYQPLCPAVIKPTHYVREDVGYTFEGEHRRRAGTRRAIGRVTHQVHTTSRTFAGGFVTGLLGALATFPLVARVLAPRLTAQIRRRFGQFVRPPSVTQLQLERYRDEPGPDNGHVGYTLDEMVAIVERLLRDIGLTSNFSRLVVITGHGSSSLNNPHESAYNCGACAGKRGGPNARAFAHMANDWRIRSRLAEQGIVIPDDTCFVGSYHNTCDDSVVWYDLDRLPASHRDDFEHMKEAVDAARRRNAHERSRRFGSADRSATPDEALRHVEERSEDLSQARPEYNHATNALCFVGRRDWSRGLFLDRRAFLTSYDSRQDDDESSILMRILAAAIPVCAGISLEYYFSTVDPVVYGSGSKLPHNIVSLLGVMEGAASDLRTGLYQQMIELHEPMRLLFVVETTPDAMESIIARHEGIAHLVRGEWVQLAVLNPEQAELHVFERGRFRRYEPSLTKIPSVESSAEWYDKKSDHLGFVAIGEARQ